MAMVHFLPVLALGTLVSGAVMADFPARPDVDSYPAMAGLTASQVIETVSGRAPLPADVTQHPWCDRAPTLGAQIGADFGERAVGQMPVKDGGATLFGSAIAGTWTLTYTDASDVSCVVASGTGFDADVSPRVYFDHAGLA